jgi:hypothetical protein
MGRNAIADVALPAGTWSNRSGARTLLPTASVYPSVHTCAPARCIEAVVIAKVVTYDLL